MLGMQLIHLAILTKWVDVLAGIVPEPRRMRQAAPYINVEGGLFAGLVAFIFGFTSSSCRRSMHSQIQHG